MGISEVVQSIIVNMFSTDISSASVKIVDKIKFYLFKKRLNKNVHQFTIDHDGTILTSGKFERFLKNYHPIEKAFKNIAGVGEYILKDQFISEQLKVFWDVFPDAPGDYRNRAALKEFLDHIYDQIDRYYKSSLSKNELYLDGVVNRVACSLEQQIDVATSKIERKIDQAKDELGIQIVDEVRVLLEKQNELDCEEVWSIFSALSKSIFNGKFSDVCAIVPLLAGKSKDLETGIKYYLDLFQGITEGSNSLTTIEAIIEDDRIYQDLAEKTIYLSLVLKAEELMNQIGNRSLSLYEIKGYLLSKKYDAFYSLEKTKKDGVTYFEYKLRNDYPDHEWLVKRICAISILEQPIINASDSVLSILNETNVIDRIVINERRVNELANRTQVDDKYFNELMSQCDTIAENIVSIPNRLRSRFFSAYLRLGVIRSSEEANRIKELIPETYKNELDIRMLLLQVDVNKGIYDYDSIINVCNKADQYWLFNNVLGALINRKPEEAKCLLEKYKFVIDKDPMLYLLYVQLVHNIDGGTAAEKLFAEYEERYGNYLEYWLTRLRRFYAEEDIKLVIKKWLNSEYDYLTNSGNYEFITLLMEHGCYSEALQGVLQIENSQRITGEYLRIKAIALLKTKHEIEALEAFNRLFREFNQTDENVYYILMLSVNNKRLVSDAVINYAKASENATLLLMVAQYSEINSLEGADQLILKALLRTTRTDRNGIQAYGKYLGLHTKGDHTEEIVIKVVDKNTVVYLEDQFNNTVAYCIHGNAVLPCDFYEWEKAIHIYQDTAIRLGLLRKKTNDNVEIDYVKYKVIKIEPLDYFMFHVCINKMVQTENAQMIKTPSDEEGHIDTELFKEQLRAQLGDNSNRNGWLDQYRNLEEMPVSIYLYSKYVRVTYTQLIDMMIQDPSIFIREATDWNEETGDYIFSTASIVSLRRIGFDMKEIADRISIPSSLSKLISDDADITIADNNREHVASMGMENGQLYFLETPDDVKQRYMSDAVELKDYVATINSVVNTKDLPLIEGVELDIKDFLGIADYDSLVIAKEKGCTLVASEIPIIAIANLPELQLNSVGIAGFISHVCKDASDILHYTEELVKYRYLVPFDDSTIRRLVEEFEKIDEDMKHQLLQSWQKVLLLPLEDDSYKGQLLQVSREVLSRTKDSVDNTNPIWSSLLHAAIRYSGYSVRISIANGMIETQFVKDTDDHDDYVEEAQ